MAQTDEKELFTYEGKTVKVITVFNHKTRPTALVEDKKGNIFPVKKELLRMAS